MAAGKRKIIESRKKDRPMKKNMIDLKKEMKNIKLHLDAFSAVQAKLIEAISSLSASPNRDQLMMIRNFNLNVKQMNVRIGEDYIDEMLLKLTADEVNGK
ncbi:hypothetical protein CCACVL1_10610 [Corchorus capsularis]|uniref:Uncharacterized protein n=1 Tax=Corchorus capsularis TaxID=210143 RepID=A0A1R3IQK8_COCAP|nr:hypothetical protein CCACVL1_10610 [Corchorus capsularis]